MVISRHSWEWRDPDVFVTGELRPECSFHPQTETLSQQEHYIRKHLLSGIICLSQMMGSVLGLVLCSQYGLFTLK